MKNPKPEKALKEERRYYYSVTMKFLVEEERMTRVLEHPEAQRFDVEGCSAEDVAGAYLVSLLSSRCPLEKQLVWVNDNLVVWHEGYCPEGHEPEEKGEGEVETRQRLRSLIRMLERSVDEASVKLKMDADELERVYLEPAREALGEVT